MKQCSICGYLFEPENSQSPRCPRCGANPDESSLSENSQQPSFPSPQEPEKAASIEEETAVQSDPAMIQEAEKPKDLSEEITPSLSPQPEESSTQESLPTDSCSPDQAPKLQNDPPLSSPAAEAVHPSPNPPRKRKRRKGMRLRILIFVLLLCLVAICSFLLGMGQQSWFAQQEATPSATEIQHSDNEYYDPQGVSPEEFARLELGMTYAQISGIIGGDAYETTVPDVSGSYSAAWQGQEDPQAVLTVRFVNGQAVDLQQNGLNGTQSQESESSQAQ